MNAQPSLFGAPLATHECAYQCGGRAILGPERYNATRTSMNQTAICQKCGRVGDISYNLTLRKGAA